MIKALIVYTSLTGNTRECAEIIEGVLNELDVEVTRTESTYATPEDFYKFNLCIVGTYTYGIDGSLPDEIVDFYDELAETDLTGKVFGTFGSGDTFYEKFCKSVDDFTAQFLKTGAIEGARSVKIDLDPEEEEKKALTIFAENLVHTWKTLH